MGAHSFADLIEHVGHKLQCVYYGEGCKRTARNVAVECTTCNEVLTDFDRDEEKPYLLAWANPKYKDLKCKCGNTLEFKEIAFRATIQPFVMKGEEGKREADFEDYDTDQESVHPTSIECAQCGEEVWSADKKKEGA